MSEAPPAALQATALALQRLATDPQMPAWLARSLRWTAGDLLAEAECREQSEPPAAANDNGSEIE